MQFVRIFCIGLLFFSCANEKEPDTGWVKLHFGGMNYALYPSRIDLRFVKGGFTMKEVSFMPHPDLLIRLPEPGNWKILAIHEQHGGLYTTKEFDVTVKAGIVTDLTIIP